MPMPTVWTFAYFPSAAFHHSNDMKKLKVIAKWTGFGLFALLIVILLLFRFDVRVLAGFDTFVSESPAIPKIQYFGPEYDLVRDEVSRVLTSKVSRIVTFCDPSGKSKESSRTCIGPTLVIFKSGRVVVTGGATISFDPKLNSFIVAFE